MFRKENMKDITDTEFDNIVVPHMRMFDSFMQEFIIPEVCAFYIATGFRLSTIWENTFDIHISTVLSMLTDQEYDMEIVKNNIKKIFLVKYNLKIVKEKPLILEDATKFSK